MMVVNFLVRMNTELVFISAKKCRYDVTLTARVLAKKGEYCTYT